MKVATYLAHFLKAKGVDAVFELQGGMITRLLDELNKIGGIEIVSMHHEQAAAFAADAYARIRNIPGIAFATSGPGATNLITGIGSCYFDSVPAIFITGQVNLSEQKGERLTRQVGFQEMEIVSMVRSITKAAFAIRHSNEIMQVLEDAWKIASEGRPGPVLIDIPMNIQNEEIPETEHIKEPVIKKLSREKLNSFIDDYFITLRNSEKPLILAGHGVRLANATGQLVQFVEKFDLPVVCSLLGLDNIAYDHPNRVGFIGTYGNRWANYVLGTCDLLLVVGSRLDIRQTGNQIDSFVSGKQIFHVDIDINELSWKFNGSKSLCADLRDFLQEACITQSFSKDFSPWHNEIKEKRKNAPDVNELINIKGINPNIFMHQLSRSCVKAPVIVVDTGNNQMWAGQSFELIKHQRLLTSGGMGAMGYSLPAAIGASFATGKGPVVSISGDGGFQINIQELQTITRNNLPVKIIILDNKSLGMIRQFQDAYFNGCYTATVNGYNTPDFVKVGRAYGIDSISIKSNNEIEDGLNSLWANKDRPFLLVVNIDFLTNVSPKVIFGNALTDMEPSLPL
jgi:acetolactate synthase-1/2/3 large subunit